MTELLALENVTAGYGESRVLEEVSFALQEGDSLALLGRNGVGKSTLLLTLMGLTRFHGGAMRWQGGDLAHLPTHRRAQSGLGWVPQERLVFPSLTVEEHLTVVARPGPWTLQKIYDIFPRLHERRMNLGNQLSGGEQQMLAIARALMVNPRLLLLDEPMEGLAPIIVQELTRVIETLVKGEGMTVIVVEQHARLALSLTARAIVLEHGRIVHDGDSGQLLGDPQLLGRLLAVA
ncbi:ABC transporter ATP-binding protein [Oxalobacteraceae bacterium CAVE-383]|nr:ABC transporter ATP-binding protein [Oxalobacteraceae bacterium CAVE-383]